MTLRRAVSLATALAATLALAGCSTEEGQRAQELLLQADAAQRQLTSSSFEGDLSVELAGRRIEVRFEGAGSKRQGYMAMRGSGIPGAGEFAVDVVVRGQELWLGLDGSWQKLPAAAAPQVESPSLGPAAFAELARHVRDVRVTEHQLVDGRSVSVVAGEIDTAGLLASLSKLGGLGDVAPSGLDLESAGASIGDIEAVLTIDEQSRLLTSALVSLSLEAAGETAELRLRYRLSSWNEPVRIPAPGD